MPPFKLVSDFQPKGDQPKAIKALVAAIQSKQQQWNVLLGATGTGKTYTMAHVIEQLQRPTLVLTHNKTLAAQLYQEFKSFFPENAVEYFVSYYDYYQPEAYVPRYDKYIEKEVSINEEIDRMRNSATRSLLERRDVIVVASVSCIYGLGSPRFYKEFGLLLQKGEEVGRQNLLRRLVEMQYTRNDLDFYRGRFRARGDVIDVFPIYEEQYAIRIELFGDTIERLTEFEPLTQKTVSTRDSILVFPAKHYVTPRDVLDRAIQHIQKELDGQVQKLETQNKLVEAQRLQQRTNYDLEMLTEMGYCQGIENYSFYLDQRQDHGDPAYTLLDFFPDDFMMIVDESHVTLPQVRGMYEGDKARKKNLVEYGFRLPSAYDNRPLKFSEYLDHLRYVVCTSATPGKFERDLAGAPVEQIIRPTGLIDPQIEVRPTLNQVDDLVVEIGTRRQREERIMVTTLTKRMAEDLTDYLVDANIKARYLHSEIDTLERVGIIRDLRSGEFDVLIGVNLLREGLDLPEVSLVAIFDADKEGYLRTDVALIQTIGRAARHVNGTVLMYADNITRSMQRAIDETDRRRKVQMTYNETHGITPTTIQKAISEIGVQQKPRAEKIQEDLEEMPLEEIFSLIPQLEEEMRQAAQELEFERAATIRDKLMELRKLI
ncbi:MAG: excinuclease ABC subunit UvrB [Candidatus Heimdallarchaeota archaeon]